jgi:hypothetical protein
VPGEVAVEGGAFGATRDIDKSQRVTMTALFDREVSYVASGNGAQKERNSPQQTSLCPRRTTQSFRERISNIRTAQLCNVLACRFLCRACKRLYHVPALMARSTRVTLFALLHWAEDERYVQRRDRSFFSCGDRGTKTSSSLPVTSRPIAGCHSTHLTSHPWSARIRSSLLSAKDDQTRTVESSPAVAKRSSSRRETLSTYGLSMCGPCSEVDHVGLEILDDSRLVRGRDVGARVVEGQCPTC